MRDQTFSSESVTAFVVALAISLREGGLLLSSPDENPQQELLRLLDQNLAAVGEDSPYASRQRCFELEKMRDRLQQALNDPTLMLFDPPEGRA